ncbi:MAG: hypothetical protein RBR86_02975 [Pseudobdellovibrionaceae bacterium]|jgi:hypothetical protein|nr:hypothetical protein [Pseudobdellovibrionaceae bacterium]
MKLSEIIKENRVLIAGLLMPLALIILFTYAKTIPDMTVPDPTYKAVYAAQTWGGLGQITFKVDDNGKVAASFTATSTPSGYDKLPTGHIFIYDPKTMTTDRKDIEISTDLLKDAQDTPQTRTKDTNLDVIKNLTLSKSDTAPDGYRFETYHYRNRNLISDIFMSGSRNNGPALLKDNRVIRIDLPNNTYYYDLIFLGWVTKEE